MENSVGYVVVFDERKDLGLVNISGIGPGIKDPVGIDGKGLAMVWMRIWFLAYPFPAFGGQGREEPFLPAIDFGLYLLEFLVKAGVHICTW